jgi:hypothetical protein
VCRRPGAHSAHTTGAERVARSADQAAAGARARSGHTIGAERAARWQPAVMAASGCPARRTGAQRPRRRAQSA